MSRRISRRAVLRGAGTALSLPLLEAMWPRAGLAAAPAPAPTRLAFVFVPNGAHMADWTPSSEGEQFDLSPTLEPLGNVREYLNVLSGLAHQKADANGDGPGDHARSAAAFLTGCQPYKTAGANIKVGVSIDQVAAEQIGARTRLPSLELGCDPAANSGNCDSGYSCAYSGNISWKSESQPMAKETNPRAVFDRLFGDADSRAATRDGERKRQRSKSILDFVLEDAERLQRDLSASDKRKLDEYMTGVRELERRIVRAEQERPKAPAAARPENTPGDNGEHIRMMNDLIALAFQADLTRICTFMIANEGSNRPYPQIGVSEGHHDLSHHGNDKAKQEKIAKINRFHMEQFAHLLEKLKSIREGEGNLLQHSMIVYGSAIGDGNAHNHDELPFLLAGLGNGAIKSHRHLRYKRGTPANNLYLSLLDQMGVKAESVGDSTGRIENLSG